jgi:hypothetical protein
MEFIVLRALARIDEKGQDFDGFAESNHEVP